MITVFAQRPQASRDDDQARDCSAPLGREAAVMRRLRGPYLPRPWPKRPAAGVVAELQRSEGAAVWLSRHGRLAAPCHVSGSMGRACPSRIMIRSRRSRFQRRPAIARPFVRRSRAADDGARAPDPVLFRGPEAQITDRAIMADPPWTYPRGDHDKTLCPDSRFLL